MGHLEAQRRAIVAECKRRGWELVETIEDAGYSAKDLKRPGVQEALRALEAGEAKALVVAKLDLRGFCQRTNRLIAADLNEGRVPTAQGGARWYAATVRHVFLRTLLTRRFELGAAG